VAYQRKCKNNPRDKQVAFRVTANQLKRVQKEADTRMLSVAEFLEGLFLFHINIEREEWRKL
jgi:hypothetical protein